MKQPVAIQGVSLIELMIALVIGLLLTLGIIQIFHASRIAYALSEAVARNQENARFALDYLEPDFRMAGHYGCVNDQSQLRTTNAFKNNMDAEVNNDRKTALNFAVSIQGYEARQTGPGATVNMSSAASGWLPQNPPPEIIQLNPLAGSDIIVLRFMNSASAAINQIVTTTDKTQFIVPTTQWNSLTIDGVNSPVLFGVSDCNNVDFFRASSVQAGAGSIIANTPINRYGDRPSAQTRLSRAESIVYYVANNDNKQPSLFRARFNGSNYIREELIEGIESMQLLYGLDGQVDINSNPPSGVISSYETAAAINSADQWRRVGSVQLGLLIRSPNRVSADVAKSVTLLGIRYMPAETNDWRLRSGYEVTIALRNRLYGN